VRYENERLVNDDGPSRGASSSSGPWANIRARSILEFVNKVSACIGAPTDRALRQILYDTVFANGQSVQYNGVTYTAQMLLSMYYRDEIREESRRVREAVAAVAKGWT
jgi:hypothetical protein